MTTPAMLGQAVGTYQGAYSDQTIPVSRDDLLLDLGTLFLFDAVHSRRKLTTMPASGGSVPNAAWREAATLLGLAGFTAGAVPTAAQVAAAQAALDGVFQKDASYVEGTDGKFELSTKGGIHGIISPTTQTANNKGARLLAPAAICTYLYNNPGHRIFLGQEVNNTRALPSGSCVMGAIYDSSTLSKVLAEFVNGGTNVNNSIYNPIAGQARVPLALNPTGPQIRTGAFNTWLGAAPTPSSAVNLVVALAIWGRSAGNLNTGANMYGSYILERCILKDLDATAGTWATEDANLAKRNVGDMLTAAGSTYSAPSAVGGAALPLPTGKYNGDTYVTNPTTIT